MFCQVFGGGWSIPHEQDVFVLIMEDRDEQAQQALCGSAGA
jgi:hypothetical protein